jgi:hypothetical protein
MAKTFRIRVEEDDERPILLREWIAKCQHCGDSIWEGIARKMTLAKVADFEWYTGSSNPLQFPWYDCEAVTFKDPPRSSTAMVDDDDEDEPQGPSFGPGADKGTGASATGKTGAPSGSLSTTSIGGTQAGGSTTNTDALPFDVHTIHGNKDDKVDVTFICEGRSIGLNVKRGEKESAIQRLVANSLQMTLNGYWVATVTEGYGYIGMLCNGSTVTLTPATPAQIQEVVQARTTASTGDKPRKQKTKAPRKQTPPQRK